MMARTSAKSENPNRIAYLDGFSLWPVVENYGRCLDILFRSNMSTTGHERCLPQVIAKLQKKTVKVMTNIAPQNKNMKRNSRLEMSAIHC